MREEKGAIVPARDPLARETGYLDLIRGLGRPACPVCVAANLAARKYLDGLLWEHVNDGEVRTRLRSSAGFCREHTVLCLDVAQRQSAGLGMAILYEDLLRHAQLEASEILERRRTGRRRQRNASLPPNRPCPACEVAARTAANCIRLLGKAEPSSPIGRRARRLGAGICLPHLGLGLQVVTEREGAERLRDLFDAAAESLRAELRRFIRSQDYRYHDEPRGREQDSWLRAPRWVVGETPVMHQPRETSGT